MLNQLRPAIVILTFFILLTGLGYPFAITGIAQALMPAQANGSLILNGDKVIGSSLIGQNFTSDRYFWPRPSATSPDAYNAAASSGSNLGTTSAKLKDRVATEIARLNGAGIASPVPGDAVTTSGSGLDPHITPAFAQSQVDRIAKARNLSVDAVRALVATKTEGRLIGIIGEERVNVLELNLALDALKS